MKKIEIQHLYSRVGFGLKPIDLDMLSVLSKKEVVDQLFTKGSYEPLRIDLNGLEILNTPKQARIQLSLAELKELRKRSRKKVKELAIAWIDRLNTSTNVLNEKMTLFWANVFVCKDNNIWTLQQYNNTLRRHALGHFGEMVKAVAREPSMSKYLNNRQNVKRSPNENFARELMELFTLGIGHYTESDIKESARAFTGWTFRKGTEFHVNKKRHDDGIKSFLGETGNFDGDNIIDIILNQKQCARFICTKVYSYFVNPNTNEDHVEELTNVFYQNYDIRNLMYHLYTSDWFYDDSNIGAKIKSPIELLVGIYQVVPYELKMKRQYFILQKMMGQILLEPVNVAGWKGDKAWIDSNTLMFRMKLPSALLNNAEIDVAEKGEFEDSFEDYYEKKKVGKRKLKVKKNWESFDSQFSDIELKDLKELLIQSTIDVDTAAFLSNLSLANKRDYCIQLMSIPEYQLC